MQRTFFNLYTVNNNCFIRRVHSIVLGGNYFTHDISINETDQFRPIADDQDHCYCEFSIHFELFGFRLIFRYNVSNKDIAIACVNIDI